MNTNAIENPDGGIDNGLLAEIVHELNLAHRNVSAYPKGHPVVSRSCEKVTELFDRLFSSRREITFGVAKETLLFGADSLARLNPMVKGVARILFYHGIALITFRKGLSPREIEAFNGILALKRERVAAEGGIEQLMLHAGIEHLRISRIRYDAFHAEEDPLEGEQRDGYVPSLWERFVDGLMRNIPLAAPSGGCPDIPEYLAVVFNDRYREEPVLIRESLQTAVREVTDPEASPDRDDDSLRKIGSFVVRLNKESRRYFLDVLLNPAEGREDASLEILTHLPPDFHPEISEYVVYSKALLSPLAIEVMKRLHGNGATVSEQEARGVPTNSGATADGELEDFFAEELEEEFVPREYLETLKDLATTRDLPELDCAELDQLRQTLASERIEASISGLILASIDFASPERLEALKRNLVELSSFFLETGDFHALENMYRRLCEAGPDSGHAAGSLREEMVQFFEKAGFTAEVMSGLDIWGQEKYGEIGSLIQRIGRPFVEPLLDRLAVEESRILRRWCLDQVLTMAELAKEAVLARLDDRRWYVVRNLVIVLQHTGDPLVTGHLAPVARFPHPRVRQIVLETYIRFRDPEGDRLLLLDLNSDDAGERMLAIRHSGESGDPRVRQALERILGEKGLPRERFAEKKEAIHSLARIGCPDTVPVLAKMLETRHFFRKSLHDALKREMVLSLAQYRDASAVALLRRTAQSSNLRLAGAAAEVLGAMGGRNE